MTTNETPAPIEFEPELVALLEQEYPRFSEGERARRRQAIEDLMASKSVSHLLIYGIGGRGGAVTWLSQWLVTNEAQLVVSANERDALFVQYFNHVPLATIIASDATVAWGGASTIGSSIDELRRRDATEGSVGVIGPLPLGAARALESAFGHVVDLTAGYNKFRLIKSAEELVWFRLC